MRHGGGNRFATSEENEAVSLAYERPSLESQLVSVAPGKLRFMLFRGRARRSYGFVFLGAVDGWVPPGAGAFGCAAGGAELDGVAVPPFTG